MKIYFNPNEKVVSAIREGLKKRTDIVLAEYKK